MWLSSTPSSGVIGSGAAAEIAKKFGAVAIKAAAAPTPKSFEEIVAPKKLATVGQGAQPLSFFPHAEEVFDVPNPVKGKSVFMPVIN